MKLLRSSWIPGPEVVAPGPWLVSVTDYTADHFLDMPGIARAGYRLREAWPELPGAVGMWLWSLPTQRRVGSVSVWLDEESLRGFVRRADHREIMRRYRSRGTIQAVSWTSESMDLREIWSRARRTLVGETPIPEGPLVAPDEMHQPTGQA